MLKLAHYIGDGWALRAVAAWFTGRGRRFLKADQHQVAVVVRAERRSGDHNIEMVVAFGNAKLQRHWHGLALHPQNCCAHRSAQIIAQERKQVIRRFARCDFEEGLMVAVGVVNIECLVAVVDQHRNWRVFIQ